MSDSERIEGTIERLRAAWMVVPGLRLGELIAGSVNETELFDKEDSELIEEVEAAVEEWYG